MVLDCKTLESTARRLKEYLQALAETSNNESRGNVVDSLPRKSQGRPLLLGQEIDKAVHEYVEATRNAGGMVNTTTVMVAAVDIMSSCNVTALKSHGGHVEITKSWAKSLLPENGMSSENAAMLVKFHLLISQRSRRFFKLISKLWC